MILVGLDDTDIADSRGTNQLARQVAARLAPRWRCVRIVRHQLLLDDRVPYTSGNGSASMWLEPVQGDVGLAELMDLVRDQMLREFIPGSDPGLCLVAGEVPQSVVDFALRCQREIVSIAEAEQTAEQQGLFLRPLGGTGGGVIGALAAVGLAATRNDGRIVSWDFMDGELTGLQPVSEIVRRGVNVRRHRDGALVHTGQVDVGKKLRPNVRDGQAVLFVERSEQETPPFWKALKLP